MPSEPTYEDSLKNGTVDTLKGTIVYSTDSYPSRHSSGYSSSIISYNLSSLTRKPFRQYSDQSIFDLSISPDTKMIAYLRRDQNQYKDYLLLASYDTSNSENIISVSDSTFYHWPACPSWTSDNQLAYLYGSGFNWELRNPGPALNIGRKIAASRMVFLKNGTSMLFSSYDGDSLHTSIFAYNFSTQSINCLVKTDYLYTTTNLTDPSISPDGNYIVFTKNYANLSSLNVWLGGGNEIWTARIDGTNLKMVAKIIYENPIGLPSWSPDGKKIAYLDLNQLYINSDGTGKFLLMDTYVESFRWIQ
jgi:Tol biopolymer transport system component